MKKLRVLLLVHDLLLPPPDAKDLDWEETYPYQMELDVQSTLCQLGHEVETLGVGEDLDVIRQRAEAFRPHVAFNVLTDFHDITAYESHVVSYLELIKLPYTGCNRQTHSICSFGYPQLPKTHHYSTGNESELPEFLVDEKKS